MNKKVFVLFVFGILFSCFFVSAEMLTSEAGVSYDTGIVEAFENQTWIRVGIVLNVSFKGNTSFEEKKEIINQFQEAVLQGLSKNNIKGDINKLSVTPGFFITINKDSFDNLKNNPNVESINLVTEMHANSDKEIISVDIDMKNYNYLIYLGILIILIILYFLLKKWKMGKNEK